MVLVAFVACGFAVVVVDIVVFFPCGCVVVVDVDDVCVVSNIVVSVRLVPFDFFPLLFGLLPRSCRLCLSLVALPLLWLILRLFCLGGFFVVVDVEDDVVFSNIVVSVRLMPFDFFFHCCLGCCHVVVGCVCPWWLCRCCG